MKPCPKDLSREVPGSEGGKLGNVPSLSSLPQMQMGQTGEERRGIKRVDYAPPTFWVLPGAGNTLSCL